MNVYSPFVKSYFKNQTWGLGLTKGSTDECVGFVRIYKRENRELKN